MATAFKKGDLVAVKAVIPSGPVESIRMDDDGVVYYLISWVDADEYTQSRWFAEESLDAA